MQPLKYSFGQGKEHSKSSKNSTAKKKEKERKKTTCLSFHIYIALTQFTNI